MATGGDFEPIINEFNMCDTNRCLDCIDQCVNTTNTYVNSTHPNETFNNITTTCTTTGSVGFLDGPELEAMVLKITGRTVNDAEIAKLLGKWDLDGDGRISQAEYNPMAGGS